MLFPSAARCALCAWDAADGACHCFHLAALIVSQRCPLQTQARLARELVANQNMSNALATAQDSERYSKEMLGHIVELRHKAEVDHKYTLCFILYTL